MRLRHLLIGWFFWTVNVSTTGVVDIEQWHFPDRASCSTARGALAGITVTLPTGAQFTVDGDCHREPE